MLDRDAILAANDIKTEEVDVPEWGGTVMVRGMTGLERDDYEQSLIETKGMGRKTKIETQFTNANARMAVKCIVNEDGLRLFADADALELGQKSAAALVRVVDVARRLSGMTDEDVEELEKN